MKITRKGHVYYLPIKIKKQDAEYLTALTKYAPLKFLTHVDANLSRILSLHLKMVFVMSAAEVLLQTKKISKRDYNELIRESDKQMKSYAKIIDKYFEKFGNKLI